MESPLRCNRNVILTNAIIAVARNMFRIKLPALRSNYLSFEEAPKYFYLFKKYFP